MYSDFVERDGFQHAIPINIDDIDDIPEEIRRIFRNRPKFPPTDGDELDFELAEKNLDDDFPDYIPEDIKKLLKKLRERSGGDGVIRPKMEFVDYEDSKDFKFEKAGGDKTSEDGKTSRVAPLPPLPRRAQLPPPLKTRASVLEGTGTRKRSAEHPASASGMIREKSAKTKGR
jgi:hypothetical protein